MAQTDLVAGRPRRRARRARVLVGAALCAVALGGGLAACGDDDDSATTEPAAFPTGTPTEVTDVASGFPAPNGDYSNTRAVGGKIDASNVATLEAAWSVPLAGESPFGVYSSTPIVTDDTVYLQDINSNVQAVDRATGEVKWTKKYDSLSVGPNGVAIGGGLVVGGTADGAFALDADTGEVMWEKLKLIQARQRGRGHGPADLERHRVHQHRAGHRARRLLPG